MSRKYGALTSSQNPEEIANKVKGTVLAISSVVIFVAAKFFQIEISVNDMTELAGSLGTLSGLIWAVYGVILHLIAKFYEWKNSRYNTVQG